MKTWHLNRELASKKAQKVKVSGKQHIALKLYIVSFVQVMLLYKPSQGR